MMDVRNAQQESFSESMLPLVSVMIATYNSSKVLRIALDAIARQDYPQDKLELLVIDGGSKDDTLTIAKQYGCRIINNPKTEPVHAKLIGFGEARGKFLIILDHDEEMVNPRSIRNKVLALLDNPTCHAALCSGYECPPNYPGINQYISEYGDPYSLYLYHFSKGNDVLEKTLRKHYTIKYDCDDYLVVDFKYNRRNALFEFVAAATMIDREYFIAMDNRVLTDKVLLVQLFYSMLEHGTTSIILMKNDPLMHYSADSLRRYFPKLKWRICNNVHFPEKGAAGFNGREKYQSGVQWKKYLFIPYSLTLLLPLIEGIWLAVQRRNATFLWHPVLSLYVSVQILHQYLLKLLHITPGFRSYDGKAKIAR